MCEVQHLKMDLSSPFDIGLSQDYLTGLWSLKQQYSYGSGGSVGSEVTVFSSDSGSGLNQQHEKSLAQKDGEFEVDFTNLPFSVLRFLDAPTPMDEFNKNGVSSDLNGPDISVKSSTTKAKKTREILCPFCRNNGESSAVYRSHGLKDANGKITCPVLRRYVCPICKSTGDNAHTISYCPSSKSADETKKTGKKSAGKKVLQVCAAQLDSPATAGPCHVSQDARSEVDARLPSNENTPPQPPLLPPSPPQVRIRFVPIPVSAATFASLQMCQQQQALSSSILQQQQQQQNRHEKSGK